MIVAPLHAGILVAGLAAVFVYIFIEHTATGYDVKALGANPTALRFMGVRISRVVVLTMVLSGALAGLAGACELLGAQHRLKADYLAGLGYNGIIVSMVGGLHPAGTVVVAILFGGLTSGSIDMRVTSGVPDAIVQAMQGTILLCVLAGTSLARYRVSWSAPR
jgi:simple sugar transport system permease protein